MVMLSTKKFKTISHEGLITINPHEGQIRVLQSIARFIMNLAGSQGGKTCLGPVWLHREVQQKGGGDYLATTSTYDMFKLKMLPELLSEFVEGSINGANYRVDIGKYWPGLRVIELAEDLIPGKFWAKNENDRMWGRIILRSADAKAGLESATAKAAWLDELGQKEFTREAWEATLRRLSLSQGRILGTTSLYYWGWLKTELYDRWKAGDESIDVIQYDSLTNPAFPREEYERAERTMPRWKFNLFYRGMYEKPAGLIYDSFNETCKIDRFPISDKWPRFVGHDFGGANPAAMFYAQDPGTGYFYAYYEYLPGGGKSTSEHVNEFKKITQGMNVIKRSGGSHQEDEIRQGYTAHGWPIQEPKIHSVEAGIDKVYALHKLNKLFVFNDLHSYLDEKMSYSRELDNNYKPTEVIADKAKYHLMDAERYILSDFTPETVNTEEPQVYSY